jgi:predicted DNA-binding transcriptional regulator AlpA
MSSESKLLKTRDVATLLGVTLLTVYDAVRLEPTFPKPFRIREGGRLYWREATVQQWIMDREKGAQHA